MNISPTGDHPITRERVESGYVAWAERLAAAGWSPYLLTFVFAPIGGSPGTVLAAMIHEVERVYATHVTRVVRYPRRPSAVDRLPVWLCAPDRPVFKRARSSLRDVAVNGGQHLHALAFDPPWSRLGVDLVDHFTAEVGLYVRPGHPLDRIDAVPVTSRLGYVVGYGRKGAFDNATREDASFVLPRTIRELGK